MKRWIAIVSSRSELEFVSLVSVPIVGRGMLALCPFRIITVVERGH
jgi:hypothetical protein